MKLAHLTAGTGGWWCGACLRDESTVRALRQAGHHTSFIPLYLPLRLEALTPDAPVFFGGLNVWLQQQLPMLRHLPLWADRPLDATPVLRMVGRAAAHTTPASTGPLTVSMLRAHQGTQPREVARLVAHLAADPPDAILLSNSLLAGVGLALREQLGVPVVGTFQSEADFLDALPPADATEAWQVLAKVAPRLDGWVATSPFVAARMSSRLGLPGVNIRSLPPAIDANSFQQATPANSARIAHVARLTPDKGLDRLIGAVARLRDEGITAHIHAGGALAPGAQAWLRELRAQVDALSLHDQVQITPDLSAEAKRALLASAGLFCVPSRKAESVGWYHIEAMAAGLPLVAPRSGNTPGLLPPDAARLFTADSDDALVDALRALVTDPPRRAQMGCAAHQHAASHFQLTAILPQLESVLRRATAA